MRSSVRWHRPAFAGRNLPRLATMLKSAVYKPYTRRDAMPGLTQQRVHDAIRELLTAGAAFEDIALRDIRTVLKTGSLSTIKRHRSTFPLSPPTPPPLLADLVNDSIARALHEIDLAAQLERRWAESEAMVARRIDRLEQELAVARRRLDELETQTEIGRNARKAEADKEQRALVQSNLSMRSPSSSLPSPKPALLPGIPSNRSRAVPPSSISNSGSTDRSGWHSTGSARRCSKAFRMSRSNTSPPKRALSTLPACWRSNRVNAGRLRHPC